MNEKAAVVISAGLDNLGNTCYMNSVVQCLKRVNELKDGLKTMRPPTDASQMDPNMMLTLAGGQLMKEIETKDFSYRPMGFVHALRTAYPIFDEVDDRSRVHKQQDADEALVAILQAMRGPLQRASEDNEDVIGNLFEIEMKTKYTNTEMPTEVSEQTENVFKLTCTIENGAKPADTMNEGMKLSLKGQLEKNSESLGRDSVWDKETKVNRLVSNTNTTPLSRANREFCFQPKYLCVNFVRFYWKQASNTGGTEAGKAKILRNVSFPKVFDIFEFCTDELKESLLQGRELETKNR